jgi:bifunctional pyridoxal-dependent enzyme with beta-cystathionase and maltose regulon repressor activities
MTQLDPEILEVEWPKSNSMFGWAKKGPKFNAAAVKVNMIDGEMFGKPGYVRFNLAVDPDLIKTAIERLNKGSYEEI